MAKTSSKEMKKDWSFIGYEIPSRRVAEKLKKATEEDTIHKSLIRQITGSHDALEVDSVSKTITFWKIYGMNCISSDSSFQTIEAAINEKSILSQDYLQQKTGHLLPIDIDFDRHFVHFMNF